MKIRRFPTFDFENPSSTKTTKPPSIFTDSIRSILSLKLLNKTTQSNIESSKQSEAVENIRLTPIQSIKDTVNKLDIVTDAETSLYSVGYILDPSTTSDQTTQLNLALTKTVKTIASDQTANTISPSMPSNPTTTTFPPTTLDYTTPFTTATKSSQNSLQLIEGRKKNKGKLLSS